MKNTRISKNIFIFLMLLFKPCQSAQVSIIGPANIADGIGQHSISFINCLYDEVPLQYIRFGNAYTHDLATHIQNVIKRGTRVEFIRPKSHFNDSSITIYTGVYAQRWFTRYLKIPIPKTALRLAFTVFERIRVPDEFVQRFNKHFDALLVPDEFLVSVYKNSGVTILIFVLPLSLNLDPFLEIGAQLKAAQQKLEQRLIEALSPEEKLLLEQKNKKPFVFGTSSTFINRKNHGLVIDAFHQEFGNDNRFELRLHGRRGELFESLEEKIKKLNVSNIKMSCEVLEGKDFTNFISSLDCYVLVSKAEGFSISPREALAAGVPCIVSNNTSHQTICNSGFVYAVPSHKTHDHEMTALSEAERFARFDFDCEISEVRKALREVYSNHQVYKERALQARDWVSQYTAESLSKKYVNLVQPQKIVLGLKNEITENGLITDSEKLYNKYRRVVFKKPC